MNLPLKEVANEVAFIFALILGTLVFIGRNCLMDSDRQVDVLLAFTPFGIPNAPSLGLSLLKGGLKSRGIDSQIAYYNLDFVKAIGPELYKLLCGSPELRFVAEWVFSQSAFGYDRKAHDETLVKLMEEIDRARKRSVQPDFPIYLPDLSQDLRERLIQAREKVEPLINSCVDHVERINPKILGFSTMFSQNCSSLAVARRVKERLGARAPTVILGGSNCEGIMGYTMLKAFPWVDYVCCGEGDKAFFEFATRLLDGEEPHVDGIPGHREDAIDEFSTPRPVANMDDLPFPDFEDYFASLHSVGVDIEAPFLTAETSRGCWWGEKSHCTFCGLNGRFIKYRTKTADRIFRELKYMVERWGPYRFQMADNNLNPNLSFLPELVRSRMKLDMQFNLKANLNREKLRLLKAAGIQHIQPGIESFSDDTLRLMRKGVTGLQNVWLLKCCREMNIDVSWNLLFGFPEEKASEYERMRHWVPLLTHLEPPGFQRIHVDRFSPFFECQRELGICDVRAASQYRLIYPLDDKKLYDLAYFFDFDYEDGRDPGEYTEGLGTEIKKWISDWNMSIAKPVLPVLHKPTFGRLARPFLHMLGAPVPAMLGAPFLAYLDFRLAVVIRDTRLCATRTLFALTGLEARIFRYVADIRGYEPTIQHFVDLGYAANDIQKALKNLSDKKIIIIDSERCVSLAPKATASMILAAAFAASLCTLRKLVSLIHGREAGNANAPSGDV